jgi:hypothetical protein
MRPSLLLFKFSSAIFILAEVSSLVFLLRLLDVSPLRCKVLSDLSFASDLPITKLPDLSLASDLPSS